MEVNHISECEHKGEYYKWCHFMSEIIMLSFL